MSEAADVPASAAREYTCLDSANEGPESAHPGILRRPLLPLGLSLSYNARRALAINVALHPACGETTYHLNLEQFVSAPGGLTAP